MTSTNTSGLPAALPIRPSRVVDEPPTLTACRRDYDAAAPVRARLDRTIRRDAHNTHIPSAPPAEQPLTAAQITALLANYADEEA